MIGQDQHDETVEPKRNVPGTILAEDDMEVGQYVCIYNLKNNNECAPIMGQALHILALCLPYIVAQILSDPALPVVTVDCRYLNFMRVTPEFVKAQQEGATMVKLPAKTYSKKKDKNS